MTTENKIPENILAALEMKKGSIEHIIRTTWELTKRHDLTPVGHFGAFHLNLMKLLNGDEGMAFNITLGMLADHLLPLLTDEEKEALRNESVEP